MTDPAAAHEAPPERIRRLRWAIGAAFAAAVVAFVARGADQPRDPTLLPPGVTTPAPGSPAARAAARTPLAGFGETAITVHLPSGQVLEWCVLLASTEVQQQQGLMGVRDPSLGGYDGMLFRFAAPTTVSFYMKDTPMPLSIAFLAEGGGFVSQTDMAPCLDQPECQQYYAAGPYLTSLEVPHGGLVRLGIGPDAIVIDERRPCAASA
ncbi:MAG: DUF192 domain-containing protein [Acidimicrobiales bacterium]